jgi:hypothetical protein
MTQTDQVIRQLQVVRQMLEQAEKLAAEQRFTDAIIQLQEGAVVLLATGIILQKMLGGGPK